MLNQGLVHLRKKLQNLVLVWEDFIKSVKEGKEIATCKHCKKEFDGSSKMRTSHLKNRYERCPRRAICSRNEDVGQQLISISKNVSEKNSRVMSFKFDQDHSRRDLAYMIIKHGLPFNFVEYEYFKLFCANFQPQFKVVSRNTIRTDIMKIYTEEKRDSMPYLINLTDGLVSQLICGHLIRIFVIVV
ncbi:hypothetical protein QJS04_geneDACA023739 [Acorus gramineus]|uniref:BED-type domain-containing protein n=1 Tax=Acorus gramineus TaxID=55184 RepID=A0AAV9BPS2_ACOGR|nr:hypothetical protein QJS04_geneDACA023739 [Acorus gramineus]